MKKLFTNSNPFILLLAPLVFALVMGISYQFEQRKQNTDVTTTSASAKATSLFVKGVGLIKTVCSISNQDVW
jgi:hypothetical protein